MLDFFRTTEVVEFAESIAVEYDRLRRSSVVRHDDANKQKQRLAELAQKVHSFSLERKLNFYKKAKMLYAIKQGLNRREISEAAITEFLRMTLGQSLG